MSEPKIIDVWNTRTFDQELIDYLDERASAIRDYVNREKEIFLEFDYRRQSDPHLMRPSNEHATSLHRD